MYTSQVTPAPNVNKHPHIVALFDTLYRVSVPTRMMQSIEEQRMFGVRAVGDRAIDNALLNERTYTWISIAKMCEYFKDGVTVGVADPADCKKIYDAVNAHLETWAKYINRAIHTTKIPFEELIIMDKFATAVYKHARFQTGTSTYASIFAERMSSALHMGPLNMFKRPVLMTNSRTTFEKESFQDAFIPHEAEHDSLEDMLKAASVRKRR